MSRSTTRAVDVDEDDEPDEGWGHFLSVDLWSGQHSSNHYVAAALVLSAAILVVGLLQIVL